MPDHSDPPTELPPARPLLRIVSADATEEEVAAIVVAVQALAAASTPSAGAEPRSEWASPQRAVRPSFAAGRGGWRASSMPR
jgi:hypothetical protein